MSRQRAQNVDLGSDVARANLLTNGGFEIWQRGAGPFTAHNAMTADRWRMLLGGGGTMTITQDSPNWDSAFGGLQCLKGVTAGTPSGCYVYQEAEIGYALRSHPVAFRIRAKTTTPNAIRAWTANADDSAKAYSAYHSGDGTWQSFEITIPLVSAAFSNAKFSAGVEINAVCTFYLDNAMLVVGNVAADYAPLHPADDLAQCLRYYEVHGGWTGHTMLHNVYAGAGQTIQWPHHFAVRKAVTPTLTKVGTWAGANTGQPVGGDADVMMYNFAFMVTAQGTAQVYSPGGSGAAIIAEANP